MNPTFLVVRGNFSSKLFDALNRVWSDLGKQINLPMLPVIQLPLNGEGGDMGYMSINPETGEIKCGSVFSTLDNESLDEIMKQNENWGNKLKEILNI